MVDTPWVKWPSVTGATNYLVRERMNGSLTGIIKNVTGTGASFNALVDSGSYTYEVSACNSSNNIYKCSNWISSSPIKSSLNYASTLTSPFVSADGIYTVSWKSVRGATRYDLYENGVLVDSSARLYKNFLGTTKRYFGFYLYQVRACKNDFCGPLSNASITVVTSPAYGGTGSATASSIASSASSTSSASSVNSASFNFNTQAPATFKTALDFQILPSLGASQLVATTQGNLNVANGSAQYTVAIELPPAVRNLKPDLSLTYRSGSGNGLMGVGWSLSGLSSISRCRASFSTDGAEAQQSNLRYTNGDRLCLDGQKLVLSSSSIVSTDANYWASGAEYKTEIDNFSKVKAFGSANGAHAYFKVWTKDGRVLTYGGETNINGARMYRPGYPNGDVSAWALEKVEDAYGNNYTVSYIQDSSTNDFYPKQINFAPEGAVVFNYKSRLGQTPISYDMGNRTIRTKVLENVTTYINAIYPSSPESGIPVRQYKIAYKVSANTKRELVDTITECGYDLGSQICARPLTFKWQQSEFGFNDVSAGVYQARYCDNNQPLSADQLVDLDSDGYSDGINKKGGVSWGTPQGCFTRSSTLIDADGVGNFRPAMTKTGYGLLYQNGPLLKLIYNISRTSFNVREVGLVATNGTSNMLYGSQFGIGDVNRDGLTDATAVGYLHTQDNSIDATFQKTGEFQSTALKDLKLLDMDGDGVADKLKTRYESSTDKYIVIAEPGTKPIFNFEANSVKSDSDKDGVPFYALADINGDGSQDFLIHHVNSSNVGYWYYRLNTQSGNEGDEINTNIIAATSIGKNGQTDLLSLRNHYSFSYDYDKDGNDDLIASIPSGPNQCYLRVLLSRSNTIVNLQELKASDGSTLVFHQGAGASYCRPADNIDNLFLVVGDINNDGIPDAKVGSSYYPGKVQQPDLLTSVTDGFAAETQVEYSTLTDSIYTPDISKPTFPRVPASRGMQVVKKVSVSNGAGGFNTQTFKYAGAKMDLQGRGFLGFASIAVTNSINNVVTTTSYRQDFPFIGKASMITTRVNGGANISTVWNNHQIHPQNSRFPYLYTSARQDYQLQTETLSGSKTTNSYDVCGNITDQTISVGSGYNYATAQVTGELSTQHTVSEVNYSGTPNECSDDFVTKNTQTSKNVITGNIKTLTTEFTPNAQKDIATKTLYKGSNIENTTTYSYEPNGVVNTIEISAKDIDGNFLPVRKTVFSDFVKGIFPQTTRDVISTGDHISTSYYDYKFGTANYIKDPNGQISTSRFDFLGRLTESFASDQAHTELISFYCNSGAPVTCPGNAAYGVATRVNSVSTQRLAVPLSIIFYDKFQREVRQSRFTLNGSYINVAKEYTPEGRLNGVSEPFATQGSLSSTSATAWTRFSDYDALGRANTVTGSDGGSKKITYSKDGINLKTESVITIKNAQGNIKDTQTTMTYTNPLGQVARVEDALGTPVIYEYDGAGNLSKTVVNGNSDTTINIDYDDAGNKIRISDPDAGLIDFEYNGFGEMRRQTWQKNTAAAKSITYEFDQLGRNTSRVDKSASSETTAFAWVWDTKQKNKLTSVSGNGQAIEYGYDGYSRVSTMKTSITGLADKTFSTTYDEFSRPSTVTYPNGFRIQRLYNNIGLQMQTLDISDAGNSRTLWTMGNVLDGRGNLTNQLWGNGVATQTGFDTNSGRVLSIIQDVSLTVIK